MEFAQSACVKFPSCKLGILPGDGATSSREHLAQSTVQSDEGRCIFFKLDSCAGAYTQMPLANLELQLLHGNVDPSACQEWCHSSLSSPCNAVCTCYSSSHLEGSYCCCRGRCLGALDSFHFIEDLKASGRDLFQEALDYQKGVTFAKRTDEWFGFNGLQYNVLSLIDPKTNRVFNDQAKRSIIEIDVAQAGIFCGAAGGQDRCWCFCH